MTFGTKSTGRIGEELASKYLQSKGFEIVSLNFSCKYGEIDIIAKKADKLHFVEVKTRSSYRMGFPHEAVNFRKRNHLRKVIEFYILKNKLKGYRLSVDVISIRMEGGVVGELKHFTQIDVTN